MINFSNLFGTNRYYVWCQINWKNCACNTNFISSTKIHKSISLCDLSNWFSLESASPKSVAWSKKYEIKKKSLLWKKKKFRHAVVFIVYFLSQKKKRINQDWNFLHCPPARGRRLLLDGSRLIKRHPLNPSVAWCSRSSWAVPPHK